MSDLHQAVEAEITAHMPLSTPAFDVLRARSRARKTRRLAVATAMLSAVAITVGVTLASVGSRGPGPRVVAASPGTGRQHQTTPPPPGPGTAPGTSPFRAVGATTQIASSGASTNLVFRLVREPGAAVDRAVLWVMVPGALQPDAPGASAPGVLRTLRVPAVPDGATEITFAFDGRDDAGNLLALGSYSLGFGLSGVQPDGRTATATGPYGSIRLR